MPGGSAGKSADLPSGSPDHPPQSRLNRCVPGPGPVRDGWHPRQVATGQARERRLQGQGKDGGARQESQRLRDFLRVWGLTSTLGRPDVSTQS